LTHYGDLKQRSYSLRIYLYFLLLSSVVPAFIFALFSTIRERDYRASQIQTDAIQLNELALISQREFVERVRQFLVALASLPSAQYQDEAQCNALMKTLLEQVETYINVGIADLNGTIQCSGIEVPAGTNVSDRWYFQRVLETGRFAIGEYQVGRVTGKRSLQFGYPLRDASDTITGVLFAAVDLNTIYNVLSTAELPAGATFTLFDHNGIILARFPEHELWVGRSGVDAPLIATMLNLKTTGTFEGAGLDEVARLYAFSPLNNGDEASLFLALGIPDQIAYAEMYRFLGNHFLSLTIAALVAAALLTFGVSRFILKPLSSIVVTSQRLAAGDVTSRIRLNAGPKEVRLVAEVFDHTVDTLMERESERAKAAEALRLAHAELEQRVVERTAELEAANQELESFSYSISHDLRAPLRSMNGFSRILAEDYGDNLTAGVLRYLTLVRDSADNMGMLIDDLLDFSRLSRQSIHKQTLDLNNLVQEVWGGLKQERAERVITFEVESLPSCEADPALARQVFVNLLSNAVKFTSECEQALIFVGSYQDGGETVYFVRDNGAGFDMNYASKLFGVFQRLHRAEDFEGTGVGLAIVQRIIRRHGGRIWPEARIGEGATFYFTLTGESPDVARRS
jgi:signal transduction histidine kinase